MRARTLAMVGGLGAVLALRAVRRRQRRLDLRGAAVVITGGSRGLGLALAREFGRQGSRVAICGRDGAALERARADLEGRGIDALSVPCDVTDRRQVERLVSAVADRFGRLDVLVNNAGIVQVGPLDAMTLGDFEATMAANFWGGVYATLAALPLMRRQGQGRIVNVTSIGGKLSVPHLLPYSAAKFAFVGFSEGLRAELKSEGILVTTVCPGLMRTGGPRNAAFKGRHDAEYAWFSVSDSLPGLSMDATRAAEQIVAACRAGDAEVILSLPAKVATRAQGLAPAITTELLALVNAFLPGPGGIGTRSAPGWQSQSNLVPGWIRAREADAARQHNQAPGPAPAAEPERERRPGRPGLIIGPTTGGPDVQVVPRPPGE
jgi:NAD(P)-dependent dehydrogenase (short-subunit alcohol dehydrogenase family)